MRSINKVILIGNLTRDPEMRRTPNEQYVATFGMATNREWMTKDGRKQASSEFHDIVCWGRLAEIANQYLKKGKAVYIEGYLKTRSWDDASGVKRFRTEIVAEELIMLDKRADAVHEEPAKGTLDKIPHEPMREPAEELQPTVTMDDPLTL